MLLCVPRKRGRSEDWKSIQHAKASREMKSRAKNEMRERIYLFSRLSYQVVEKRQTCSTANFYFPSG